MDTVLHQPGGMLTELPTLLTSHHYGSSPSFPELRWKMRQLSIHRSRPVHEEPEAILEPREVLDESQTSPSPHPQPPLDSTSNKPKQQTRLQDLPEEIQQGILDSLMGNLSSTSSSAVVRSQGMRNWSTAMRHPRGRHLSDLALVSKEWRRMIQERLYRHVKIKGTKAGLAEAADWFLLRPHLQKYVRHIEVWVPVWERRANQPPIVELRGSMTLEQHGRSHRTLVTTYMRTPQEVESINQAYQLASSNAALDEIFGSVGCLFPEACILTIEGGHCKKPPMIRLFRTKKQDSTRQELPVLSGIRTLVLKGAWNIMREDKHFRILADALPNIREWHTTYAKPKIKAYALMCGVVRYIPNTLTHLNICLEGFYSKDTPSPAKMRDLQLSHHLCRDLGHVLPQLEALTFTGRVCSALFFSGAASPEKLRKPRLKSLDLIVKNVCRDPTAYNDGTGIHNWAFIKSFEALVTSAVRSLKTYSDLSFLRIRFIDLDSPCPLLNPYFQLKEGKCTGIWNDEILDAVGKARSGAGFEGLDLDDGERMGLGRAVDKEGRVCVGWPGGRPKDIRVSAYKAFSEGMVIA